MVILDEIKMRLSAAAPELEKLRKALGVEQAERRLAELSKMGERPGFWDDLEAGQKVLKETKMLQNRVEEFSALHQTYEDLGALVEMAEEENDESVLKEIDEEYNQFEKHLQEENLKALLSGEYDNSNAILTFHAGAGGTEAQDWAEMLYRMYTRYAQRHDFKIKVMDYLDGDEAGIKSATIMIEGMYAYGFLKSEMGVHRLVRVSPFDSSGRRHTSFASLEVMPEIEDDTEVEIRDEDIRVDTYRSSGAGGQHINKTDSAIRITHLPTGIVVTCQNERSQHKNREMAMKMLKSKLLQVKEREHLEKIEDIKGDMMQIGWGSQIRSYVFMPYTLAKDHRTGCENGNIGAVMDGDLDAFITAYLLANKENQ